MSIGLFTMAGTQTIPVGTDFVRTSGFSTVGLGQALYCYDSNIDSAYVATNPASSFLSANNRGFRLAEQEIYATMFGAKGDCVSDNTTALKRALNYCIARQITLHIPSGTFRLENWGTFAPTDDLNISGAGSGYTILDAIDPANHARIDFGVGKWKIDIRGVTFKHFDKPIYALRTDQQTKLEDGPTVSHLNLIDVNVADSCNGIQLICWIESAFVSRYRASNIKGLVATEDTYGLALGCDTPTVHHAGDYFIEDVIISCVDGTIHDVHNPLFTNAMAIRGRRLVVNKFNIMNIVGNDTLKECAGFYAKVLYSEISNGYLYNAGHDEASFIIKTLSGDKYYSHDNIVRNVHVLCDNGKVYRGFLWECGSVYAENCTAEGVEFSGFGIEPSLDGARYTFNNCWTINSNAEVGFVVAGGDVELVNCGLASPKTGENKCRELSFVRVPTYAFHNVSLKLVGCRMQVPTTYDGEDDTNAVLLANPAGVTVNRVQIDDFVMDYQSTLPFNKRGVYASGTGSIGEFFIDKPVFNGVSVDEAVVLLGKETALNDLKLGREDLLDAPQ